MREYWELFTPIDQTISKSCTVKYTVQNADNPAEILSNFLTLTKISNINQFHLNKFESGTITISFCLGEKDNINFFSKFAYPEKLLTNKKYKLVSYYLNVDTIRKRRLYICVLQPEDFINQIGEIYVAAKSCGNVKACFISGTLIKKINLAFSNKCALQKFLKRYCY